jgi:hypothetical protein
MELFQKPKNIRTRWASFENPHMLKGGGATENRGAKGHASDVLKPGKSFTLLDTKGPGVVRRIWLTCSEPQSSMTLRGIKIEMFWEGSKTPAVSAPLGDFFGIGLGRRVAFENAFFSDPEGRSFNCGIPMPFRSHAKIVVSSQSTKPVSLFYDINVTLGDPLGSDCHYFHAVWRRENPTRLGKDFEIFPKVQGTGRFLGSNIGLIENPLYHGSWFGEGEVKIYLDGDGAQPTLVGTGTEDYVGSAWGLGPFAQRSQGCPIADKDQKAWAFYRYHVDDPVYFDSDCRVTLQNMGGATKSNLLACVKRGAKIKLATSRDIKLLEMKRPWKLENPKIKDNDWCNFYRQDDISATAYYYLDNPAG